ncbi:GNPAT.2 family protein [Megaselia abdita]
MEDFEDILRPGPSMIKVWNPAVVQKFDKYLNPQSLQDFVLKSEKVHKLIEFYSKKLYKPKKVIYNEVKEILAEIGLDRSEMVIRCCGVLITAMAKRITKGIFINKTHIERIKRQLGRSPVLYLPSHRSYLDFILMSYCCFHYDIEIPGIAAGMGECF